MQGQKPRPDASWQYFNPPRPAQHAPLRHCTFNLCVTEVVKQLKQGWEGRRGLPPWVPHLLELTKSFQCSQRGKDNAVTFQQLFTPRPNEALISSRSPH